MKIRFTLILAVTVALVASADLNSDWELFKQEEAAWHRSHGELTNRADYGQHYFVHPWSVRTTLFSIPETNAITPLLEVVRQERVMRYFPDGTDSKLYRYTEAIVIESRLKPTVEKQGIRWVVYFKEER